MPRATEGSITLQPGSSIPRAGDSGALLASFILGAEKN
jgi:hypothetical protein